MNEICCDIAIVGGGIAGVAAAVAAASGGDSVVLIDRNAIIGGLATNAEVGTICGLYRFDTSSGFSDHVGRFARDFSLELQVRSGKVPQMDRTGLKYLPYQPSDFAAICRELLLENKITQLQGELETAQAEQGKISALLLDTDAGKTIVKPQQVIDATGVSRVSKLLGLPLIETQFPQSASQIFTVCNVHFEDERNLSLVVLKALRKGVLNGNLTESEDRLYLVPGSLENGRVSLKVTVPAPPEEELHKSDLRERAKGAIEHVMDYLRVHEPAFASVELESLAPAVGVRVGDRPVGKYILQDEDVLEARKHSDSIAWGNWPMEIWSQAKRVELHHFPEGEYYDIPVGALISLHVENLYFAGRGISATDKAIASARVIGTCMQTGYAAGMLAAGSIKGHSPEEITRTIQREQLGK